MSYLCLRKALAGLLLLLIPSLVTAQQFNRERDFKRFHFGITLGISSNSFKIVHSRAFIDHDSILVAESSRGSGLNIGIISNLRLSEHFDIRFIPALGFAEKNLDYVVVPDSGFKQVIESTNLEFPLSLMFKSDRVNNFRMYILGGLKYNLDMASNAEARNAEDIVRVEQTDILGEFGVGMIFYFPMFRFSPELKWSYGILNVHTRDKNLIYSEVLDRLLTRGLLISFHFEG